MHESCSTTAGPRVVQLRTRILENPEHIYLAIVNQLEGDAPAAARQPGGDKTCMGTLEACRLTRQRSRVLPLPSAWQ